MLQQGLRDLFRRFGVDVRRLKNLPSVSFLGLGKLPIDCVLDVGANVGQFARYARRMFPHSSIHCFEPLPGAAAELRAWASTSSDAKVSVHEIALGECAGSAELIEHLDHSPSSSFLQNTPRSEQMFPQTVRQAVRRVAVETLDGWMSKQGLNVDSRTLLKLDVQGFEAQVLRGGGDCVGRVGMCMVEVTPIPLYERQSTFVEIVNLLSAGGLHYLGNLEQIHDAKGLPVYMDAIFVRQSALR